MALFFWPLSNLDFILKSLKSASYISRAVGNPGLGFCQSNQLVISSFSFLEKSYILAGAEHISLTGWVMSQHICWPSPL